VIPQKTVLSALEIANLTIEHWLAAFNLMGEDKNKKKGRVVFDWIRAIRESIFKQSDCHRTLHGQFANGDELEKVLHDLRQRNIVSEPERIKTGGSPSIVYRVNPFILVVDK